MNKEGSAISIIDVHTLSGAYVLYALDPGEEARFAKHIATCTSCAIEVAELSEAATRLADDTWAVPSPRLRTRLMGRIRRIRQQPPVVAPHRHWAWKWITRQWFRLPQPTLAVAMAATIIAGAGATVGFGVQARQARTDLASLQATSAAIEAVLTAPDAKIRTTAVSGGGTMTIVGSPARQQTVIMLAAAHAPAPGKVYQLWTITRGVAASAGILQPGQATGTAVVAGTGPDTITGVTIEPEGGSAKPTMPIVAQIATA